MAKGKAAWRKQNTGIGTPESHALSLDGKILAHVQEDRRARGDRRWFSYNGRDCAAVWNTSSQGLKDFEAARKDAEKRVKLVMKVKA